MTMPEQDKIIRVSIRCPNTNCRKVVCVLEHNPPDHFEYRSPDGSMGIRNRVTVHCGCCGACIFLRIGKKSLAYHLSRR